MPLISPPASSLYIGLMSGTSLDGLDIALCSITSPQGQPQLTVQQFTSMPYAADLRQALRTIASRPTVAMAQLTAMHSQLGLLYARWVLQALQQWHISPAHIAAIASHGQTVYHLPAQHSSLSQLAGQPYNATMQIGDADIIAVHTGITTVADFRQKHIAFGGQGAPLAPYADYALFASAAENRILLNLGGIANFTWLPAGGQPEQLIAADCGPANTLIDIAMQQLYGLPYDEGGSHALQGTLQPALLHALYAHPFFSQPLPKSTGQEVFNAEYIAAALKQSGLGHISPADEITTLSQLTVNGIVSTLQQAFNITAPRPGLPCSIYVSGGGAHNAYITGRLAQALPHWHIKPFSTLGISPQAKEAALFALFAHHTLHGIKLQCGSVAPLCMGKVSLPW